MLSFKDKVVIVTGATSGIGLALVKAFAKEGAIVCYTGRSESKLMKAAEEINNLTLHQYPILADVSSEEDNKTMAEKVIHRYGKIDILVNNAGISMRAMFEDLSMDVFRRVMDTNFYGAVYATRYCLPEIIKNKGAVVAISSINGYRGTPARTAYSASKFALNGFMESLRTEVMHRGVQTLVVCPGFTESNIRVGALNAQGKAQGESPRNESKMMSSEEVAESTLNALRNNKREIVLTAQGKLAVFLNKLMPGRMDRIVYNVMKKEKDNPLKD
jgi:dehydrogenase/reductase SDR family protein 7B